MKIWLTSDEHYDHRRIMKYEPRPYVDETRKSEEFPRGEPLVHEMNEDLILKFNERVAPEDHTYHLGDFAFHPKTVEKILPRLNGSHTLILGNHDVPHPANKKSKKEHKRIENTELYLQLGFTHLLMSKDLVVKIDDKDVRIHMDHFPPKDMELGDHGLKYPEFRPDYNIADFFLHGHVHGRWRQRKNALNVGVDVHGMYPISMDEVLLIIQEYLRSR